MTMSLSRLFSNIAKLQFSAGVSISGSLCRNSFSLLARKTPPIRTLREQNTAAISSCTSHFIKQSFFTSKNDCRKNLLCSEWLMRSCSTSGSASSNTYEDGTFIYTPKKIPLKAKWKHRGLENKYTIRPLGFVRTSGRNHKGKVTITGRGGGHKRCYRMIDFHRTPPMDGSVKEEKVLKILYDPNRSARIALVAGGNHKRYILSTVNMKPGDIIKTSCEVGRMTVLANEGDAHPLAALPIGAQVHCVEPYPGAGGHYGRAAGTAMVLIRKVGGQAILKMPSKREMSVSDKCMATMGRVSNEAHNQRVIGKAGRNRWLGWRPASGWWQRKGGWAGRKIKPIPPMKIFMDSKATKTIT
ncbi:39S ribosomal protein L2, mitochondrial-like [Anneissia japonica]|uniref:39S ribosomal protein L2, mitochondrial-like n=1 Tax=Anneissia japonica TaxID=1529436 RepID=UPI00142589B5|nr:39S ribosomal protein L2, mitochondrial-like [Anneissia japonica]XP_033127371.1 39S ribosomal protein L2, mitochondrial-like [Anneissia japonica]XP_033127372.1 39S ribosomal protein L2, mitochondrial-like [Anneissia japonica]XP_033127373.1 39S ribosomal protein L2, mitochondrial-like [Anneissia japonica]